MTNLPPANWYQDPTDPTRLRYWDGAQWTEHYHTPEPQPQPAAPAPQAPAVVPPQVAAQQPAVVEPSVWGVGTPSQDAFATPQAVVPPAAPWEQGVHQQTQPMSMPGAPGLAPLDMGTYQDESWTEEFDEKADKEFNSLAEKLSSPKVKMIGIPLVIVVGVVVGLFVGGVI